MDESPQPVSSRTVFEGRVVGVRIDRLRYADGAEQELEVVTHRGSYAILATPAPDELILVRQYRHPAGRALWELPAGTAELGEEPVDGAARELREETGFRAGRIRAIGSLYMTPGFCDEVMYFFHASDLAAGEQSLDEDERIDVRSATRAQAWELVAAGEIADAKTVLALLWMESTRGEIGTAFGR